MKVLFHSDILRMYIAYQIEMKDPDNAHKIVDAVSVDTVASTKPEEELLKSKAYQISMALMGVFRNGDKSDGFELLETYGYQPEKLPDELSTLRRVIIQNCSQGIFVPIIILADKSDFAEPNKVDILVAGYGDHPDENFFVLTINMNRIKEHYDFSDTDPTLIFPVIFNTNCGQFGLFYPPEVTAIRNFYKEVKQ